MSKANTTKKESTAKKANTKGVLVETPVVVEKALTSQELAQLNLVKYETELSIFRQLGIDDYQTVENKGFNVYNLEPNDLLKRLSAKIDKSLKLLYIDLESLMQVKADKKEEFASLVIYRVAKVSKQLIEENNAKLNDTLNKEEKEETKDTDKIDILKGKIETNDKNIDFLSNFIPYFKPFALCDLVIDKLEKDYFFKLITELITRTGNEKLLYADVVERRLRQYCDLYMDVNSDITTLSDTQSDAYKEIRVAMLQVLGEFNVKSTDSKYYRDLTFDKIPAKHINRFIAYYYGKGLQVDTDGHAKFTTRKYEEIAKEMKLYVLKRIQNLAY